MKPKIAKVTGIVVTIGGVAFMVGAGVIGGIAAAGTAVELASAGQEHLPQAFATVIRTIAPCWLATIPLFVIAACWQPERVPCQG